MDTIEVKMKSPTKKRAAEDNWSGRGEKRQASTPPRLTRSMFKKLNQNGGPPVELNPGLDMGVRRRGPRTRPPKRSAQDEAVEGNVKRTATTRERGPGLQPQEPQPTEPHPIEPQPNEPQLVKPQTPDQEKRVSEAEVAAASRLAQAAIAAGLARDTSEAGTPVVEDHPSLVRFTKKDLREILSEAVIEDEIRQTMEPHWLARMEFLTWLERPAADMHHIKRQIHRLAVRWSRDLRNRDALDVEIPISTLESWRADIVIVGGPSEDTDTSETMDERGNMGDENKGDDKEADEKEPEMEGDIDQAAKEQGDAEEGDENGVSHSSHEVAESLAESLNLAARDMAKWREAFDKEMAAEPNFRSKRAWEARVLGSQREAKILEEKVWSLDVYKSEWVTQSAMQAAEQLLDHLQKFRIGLRMDREAFWDEFDQEGAELALGKTEIDQNAEEKMQEVVQEDEAQDTAAETEDVQMAGLEAEVPDVQMTESEQLQGPNTGDGGVSEVVPGPTEQPSQVANDDNDSNPTTVKPEQPSGEETTREAFPSLKSEEPHSLLPARVADIQSKNDIPKAQERSQRSPIETYAGKGFTLPREEEKSGAQTAAEFERQDREGQAAEAGEKLNIREPTPWLPDKRGSHSPSWKWPGDRKEEPKVIDPDVNAAVEEDDKPPHEAGRNTSSELFSSRSVSVEETSNKEVHTADQALTTSEVAGSLQNNSSGVSSIQPEDIDGASRKVEDTTDHTLTAPATTPLPQDASPVASRGRSASPEITTGEIENTADDSSTASDISSLPEEPEVENTVDTVSVTPNVISPPEDTILPRESSVSTSGVPIERTEQIGGGVEETVDSISPTSRIDSLLQEVSMPQDMSSSTTGAPSESVEQISGEVKQEVDQVATTNLPQDTNLTVAGIRSGSDTGLGGEVEDTVDDRAAATLDAAGLRRGSNAGEALDSPSAISVGSSPIIVPNVRYIKPQWESLSSPVEPTYTANDNDFSANEADDGDDEDDVQVYDAVEADDREADDVDP